MSDLLKNSEIVTTLQTLVKTLKTPEDLVNLNSELTKITIEAALNGEMKDHLGYGKHSTEGYNSGNSRNGYTKKTLKSEHGEMEISTPRDRNGEFNPVFLKK
ncbi:MAG: transposase, partial [Methylococcaceae bacterium]